MDATNDYPAFFRLVNERYSCRKYTPEPVTRETVTAILDCARLAPSACNRQPWKFVVAEAGTELHKEILAAYDRPWIADIQVFVVACGLHGEAWHRGDGKDHTDIDTAIAVEHICLAAASLGVGSCWICNFNAERLAKAMKLPEGAEPIAIIPLGYALPDAIAPGKNRKPMDEIVSWGKF